MAVKQHMIARFQGALSANDGAVVDVFHIAVSNFHDPAHFFAVHKYLLALVAHISALDVNIRFLNGEAHNFTGRAYLMRL